MKQRWLCLALQSHKTYALCFSLCICLYFYLWNGFLYFWAWLLKMPFSAPKPHHLGPRGTIGESLKFWIPVPNDQNRGSEGLSFGQVSTPVILAMVRVEGSRVTDRAAEATTGGQRMKETLTGVHHIFSGLICLGQKRYKKRQRKELKQSKQVWSCLDANMCMIPFSLQAKARECNAKWGWTQRFSNLEIKPPSSSLPPGWGSQGSVFPFRMCSELVDCSEDLKTNLFRPVCKSLGR